MDTFNAQQVSASKPFITTETLCVLGEMPIPTVNRSQHLITMMTAFITSQHDHGCYLRTGISNS